jgi:cyclase
MHAVVDTLEPIERRVSGVSRRHPFVRGLREITPSAYAYLQPNGSWGLSNAGLVVGGEAAMLVDTLFDLALTREMLDAMRRAVPAAGSIDVLVNTHGDPDHTFGNQLVEGAEIIASAATAEDMLNGETPEALQGMMEAAPGMGVAGEYVRRAFSTFDFSGIRLVPPSRTFAGKLRLTIGGVPVELIEVGPAHTRGDTLVHLPGERVVFSGDILFIGGHPVMWSGSIGGWIEACDRILGLDAEVIVPGHGPITDRDGVRELRGYLAYIAAETSSAYAAGRSARDAARRIDLAPYSGWTNSERIVVTVDAIYRELAGDTSEPDRLELIAEMGRASG